MVTESGGAVNDFDSARRELRSDAERWLAELGDPGLRTSIKVGNATRASYKAEWLMRRLVQVYVERGGSRSEAILRERSEGKPLDRLTMGQYVKILEELNAAQVLEPRLSKSEIRTLNSLPAGRKGIMHHGKTEVAAVQSLLELCIWLCELSVVKEAAGE
jgi:hypothetical protein